MERRTICLPRPGSRDTLHYGDPGFQQELARLYSSPDAQALESLVALKARLSTLATDDFWNEVTHGMSTILGAEMTFIMKRMLVDEQEAAIEMPPHGAPGSCMMAAAFHYCSSNGHRETLKGTKFFAYGCPCAYMRNDKVFLIPERLNEFITENPNQLPVRAEAYMAVPLFAEGKCFAHFGAMWSKEGAAARKLSWAFIEMTLRSLEDMILKRLLDGSNFARQSLAASDGQRVIPHEAVTLAQSLRPYAGSLSHELRTPMQGVVGMLDVMYATVQEAVESQVDPQLRSIFENLKQNIEVVQDSSRRAVEAADNVVHAYDMDMSVPEGLPSMQMDDTYDTTSPFSSSTAEKRPDILIAGSNLPLARPNKRRRDEAFPRRGSNASSSKIQRLENAASVWTRVAEPSQEMAKGFHEAGTVHALEHHDRITRENPQPEHTELTEARGATSGRTIAPGLRHTDMREVFQYVINEGLKMGGRPDSATAVETEYGESIEVRSRGSDGTCNTKIIEWSVDPSVPTTMFIDEKDLTKLISCVFLNAVKFSDHTIGRIGVHARMSVRSRYISIKISDNGPGIPAAFLPKLFKAFSQENGSMTRQSDGLGLGLMVAKGIARKLGGDLTCTRAETEGPNHGSEFEIKMPVIAGEIISRPSSPFGSPMPPRRAQPPTQPETPEIPPIPVAPASPRRLTKALHAAVNPPPLRCYDMMQTYDNRAPSSPPLSKSTTPPPPTHATRINRSPKIRPRIRKSVSNPEIDRDLAKKYPLTFLVVEDNKINRKLLVSMLAKFGYKNVLEAHDGAEAVRQMSIPRPEHERIDVVLMDLWMPLMDGYEATRRILSMRPPGLSSTGTTDPDPPDDESRTEGGSVSPASSSTGPNGSDVASRKTAAAAAAMTRPTVLAVTADVTDAALERAAEVGMSGFMSKPYKMIDLQRLITEHCARSEAAFA
ncbi:hypothetical protein M433DRAFT_8736 [Acidomyces richmondensis BFW]|nr:hypothetical protein M433DRAFT_8736 [Acidomyces richmondensis BFW]